MPPPPPPLPTPRLQPAPQPDEVDFSLAIKRINDNAGTIRANANGNAEDGNLGISAAYDEADGTVIQFRLSKKLAFGNRDTNFEFYAFNDAPVCVFRKTPSVQSCKANDPLPTGWDFNTIATNKILLKAPVLGPSTFEYTLFLTKYDRNGVKIKDIVIDPKIKNGGVPQLLQKLFEPAPSAVARSDGLSSMALIGAAILLVALGMALGWILADGERRPS